MNIYHYNKRGVFYKTSEAKPNPKRIIKERFIPHGDNDDYLVPSGATLTQPPVLGKNQIAVFKKDTWIVKEDLSGEYSVINKDGFLIGKGVLKPGEDKPDTFIKEEIPQKLENPKWDGDEWIEGTTVSEKWKEIRLVRDTFLRNTDYIMLSDINENLSETEKTNWKNYRKYLRDIPNDNTDPFEVTILKYDEYFDNQ